MESTGTFVPITEAVEVYGSNGARWDRAEMAWARSGQATKVEEMETYKDAIGGSPDDLNIPLRVEEIRHECADCLSIVFAKPRGFTYNAGDWMDLRFLSADLAVGQTYSFASSPTEPNLRTTFKRGVSPFKRALAAVSPGDILLITQHGSNGFLHDWRSPALFIAGGIGITPFRSMIKAAIDTGADAEITLIYENHTDDFPFKAELDAWAATVPSLTMQYVPTETHGRLTARTLRTLLPTGPRVPGKSYIAGPPGMVECTEAMLVGMGVAKEAIKTDIFRGYV